MQVDLGTLGFAEGGYLLIKRALRQAGPGGEVSVTGTAPDWTSICAPGAAPKAIGSSGGRGRKEREGTPSF